MKKWICKIDMADMLKETEGCGFDGWVCPIWAHKEDNEIKLSLGEPVSKNTSFINSDGQTPSSWVGCVPCWNRYYSKDDAKIWADDTNCNAADFDSDNEMEIEADNKADFMDKNEIMDAIRKYAAPDIVEFE